VVVAKDRRKAVSRVGIGIIVVMALTLMGYGWGRNRYIGALPDAALARASGTAAFDTITRYVQRTLRVLLVIGLLFVIGGAVCTAVPTPAAPVVSGVLGQPVVYAVPFGLLVWFAMGVDFPESQRRFSRLA